jgi:hypothetical protein
VRRLGVCCSNSLKAAYPSNELSAGSEQA